jgi:hypothetical protein
LSELTTGRLLALVAVLLAATFGVTFAIGRATRSSKPSESEVAPLEVSHAVPSVPAVRSVATLPALKRAPRPTTTSGTSGSTTGSTTGSVSTGSTTGSTTGTPGGTSTGGGTSGNTTGGGGGGTTTE